MKILKLGDRGKEVLDVQSRLCSLGYDVGTDGVDGYFGEDTQSAVLTFQQESGLVADGVVADNTWCELVEAGYKPGERLLYLRIPPFRGADVLTLQRSLNCLGFNAGPEDGILGELTETGGAGFSEELRPGDGRDGGRFGPEDHGQGHQGRRAAFDGSQDPRPQRRQAPAADHWPI